MLCEIVFWYLKQVGGNGCPEQYIICSKYISKSFNDFKSFSLCLFAEEAAEDSLAINIAQMEKRLLHGLIHHVLPLVGSSVKTLVLAYSSAVSSKMVRNLKLAFHNCDCAVFNNWCAWVM